MRNLFFMKLGNTFWKGLERMKILMRETGRGLQRFDLRLLDQIFDRIPDKSEGIYQTSLENLNGFLVKRPDISDVQNRIVWFVKLDTPVWQDRWLWRI
jgi:hypothetical protein